MNRLIEEHDKKRKEELEKYAEELRDVQRREFLDLAAIAATPTLILHYASADNLAKRAWEVAEALWKARKV